jgi:eukaryotic-like serine/threonine-protein kinase
MGKLPTDGGDLSANEQRQLQTCCARFEEQSKQGAPRIEDFLIEVDVSLRDRLFRELLEHEIARLTAENKPIDAAEYRGRFTEFSAHLDELLGQSPVVPTTDAESDSDSSVSEDDEATIHYENPVDPDATLPHSETWPDGRRQRNGLDSQEEIPAQIGLVTVPGYTILDVLGRGGMGIVYRARDERLKRIVALKMILGGKHASEESLSRFRIEAETVARLAHPNIVQIFETGEHNGLPYVTLEYVSGGDLKEVIQTLQPARTAAGLIRDLARGVACAHAHGIVHRDLKPANILLTPIEDETSGLSSTSMSSSSSKSASPEDRNASWNSISSTGSSISISRPVPKITDFGLARQLDHESEYTKTGDVLGTPSYMAPEQAAGNTHDAGPLADVYSLGAILYAVLTGRPPFMAGSLVETLKQVLEQDPAPPSQINSGIDKDLETICLKCLEKDPARRYATALELVDELDRYLTNQPIQARPIGRLARGWRWCKRNTQVAVLSASAVWLLIVGTIVSVMFAVSSNQNAELAKQNEGTANVNAKEAWLREQEALELVKTIKSKTAINSRHLYNAKMNASGLSTNANGGINLIRDNLARWIPTSGQSDLRGWEWQLLDAHTKRALRDIPVGAQAFSVDWSPDGTYLAIGESANISILGPDNKRVRLRAHSHHVRSVRWSPDGKRLASGSVDKNVFVWDKPLENSTPKQLVHDGIVRCVDWSHDGQLLAVLLDNGELKLWDLDANNNEPGSIYATGERARFSPNGRRLACAQDRNIQIFQVDEVNNPQLVHVLQCDDPQVISIAWNPSGNGLATRHYDGTINFWNLNALLSTRKGHRKRLPFGLEQRIGQAGFCEHGSQRSGLGSAQPEVC